MIPLFKALVRPILEYGNTVWCPHLRKHIDLLEGVQRRFTKRIIGTDGLTYEERLVYLRLPSLEYRRLRGDMIEVYKMCYHFYDPSIISKLLTFCDDNRTRGHRFKLYKKDTNTKIAQNFFSNRVTNAWNNLPEETVNARSLNSFKNAVDRFFQNKMYSVNL